MELLGTLSLEAGARMTVWLPASDGDLFGPESFRPGQGFTVSAGAETWRGILLGATTAGDGSGVSLEIELADRTPVGYSAMPTPAP